MHNCLQYYNFFKKHSFKVVNKIFRRDQGKEIIKTDLVF